MKINDEKKYMVLALKLAARAKDRTYPNPMVGAVIVKNGKIVGTGYHRRAGESHAEIRAIAAAAGACSGGTLFVTLEPCDHYGRTPPCTRAIIASGIKNVNIAMKDPNPVNSGRGIRRLRNAGIPVNVGLCAGEAKRLNRKYIKFISTGLPYVTVKLAQSVDGKIAARDGTSKWISSDTSRNYVRKIRSDFDAIAVGVNTVLKDDPFLFGTKRRGSDVPRIIVDTRLRTPLDSNIVRTADRAPVIIGATELAPRSRVERFRRVRGVEIVVTRSKRSKVSLKVFLARLARKGIVNVLFEGGGELIGSLMDESLVDEVMFFIAPKIIGGSYSSVKGKGAGNIAGVLGLRDVEVRRSGDDIFVRGLTCSQG
ncbi:MAG: bifunctional diaminohydroxyphosphoribosylaminopyrimidine deaminase/5-amino-6-(5-phosphoribosylamino)uracil reductase RibD [Candidatus Makaraimicrobium thalassicum]|nr:MAG: bifunctional diaminohydroxyphosphoribosylaminopyrimidine deaminase/5-amino-6-(5-phosphoribosylamino)uracil reductase RibD [Candidatus Omnitrophota bacterium]